jgi:gp16 family phage-associated protein
MTVTADQVKKKLIQRGMTQKEWAQQNGFKQETVNRVLNGVNKGNRGVGHQIAVALGLKDPSAI